MKKLCFALLLVSTAAFAAQQSSIQSYKPPPPLKSPPPHVEAPKKPAPPPKLIIPTDLSKRFAPSGDYFNHPGVVTSKGGQWIGGDNFTNIPHSFALQVNVVKPETLELPIKKEDLHSKIADIFTKSDLTINTSGTEYEPPLPFFNMLILAYPINDGMVVAIQGRLFESVDIKRVILEKNTLFQAVTWEQTNLVVAPEDEVVKYIQDAVEQIAGSFAGRVASAPVPEKK